MCVSQNKLLIDEALFLHEIKYIFILSTIKRDLSLHFETSPFSINYFLKNIIQYIR